MSKQPVNVKATQPINIMENLAIVPDSTITDKRFYVPVLNTTDMMAFKPSSDGVIIFNKDTQLFMTFVSNKWSSLYTNTPFIVQNAVSDPVNASLGQIYYNPITNRLRAFVTGGWGTIPIVM